MAALTARPRIHAAAGKALVAPGNGDVWTADQRVVTRLSQGAHSIVQPSTILLSLFSDDGDLMITDRTQTNTQVLYKRAQAGKSSKPEWIAELDGVAIFRAKDATDTTVMFRSDGTPSGTFALTLETGGIKAEASSSPPIRAGSAIYWVRTVGFQRVVYRSRGERDDVKLVFSSSREPIYLQNLNDQLHVLRVQQNVPHSMAWALADDTGKATKILDRPYHISGLATLGDELHWIEHRPSGNHWMRQTQPSSSTVKTFPANSRLAALLSTKSHVFAFVDSDLYSYDGSQNGPQQPARYSNWTSRNRSRVASIGPVLLRSSARWPQSGSAAPGW